jgi:hypothetical protein
MRILPCSEYRLHVQQAPEEAVALLAKYVQPISPLDYFRVRDRFAGTVNTTGFEIFRIGASRNPFRAMAKASLRPAASGTLIEVAVTIWPMPLIAVALIPGLVFVAALGISFRSLFYAIAGGLPLEVVVPYLAIPLRCLALSALAPLLTLTRYWLAFPREDRMMRGLLETAFGASAFLS